MQPYIQVECLNVKTNIYLAPVAKYERVLDSGGAAVQLWSIGLPGREFTEPSLRQTSDWTAQAATSTQPKDKKREEAEMDF